MNCIAVLNSACEKLAAAEYPGYPCKLFEEWEKAQAEDWLAQIAAGISRLDVILHMGTVNPILWDC